MRTQITIKKVTQQDLSIMKNALGHYSTTMQFLLESIPDEKFAKEFSIAVELWYKLNQKTSAQFPVKKAA